MSLCRKYIALFLLFGNVIFAQSVSDSSSFSLHNYSVRNLGISFDKQVNTYNFTGLFSNYITSGDFFAGIKDNFNSTIIKSTTKNIKDDQYLSLLGNYKVNPLLHLGLLINNNIYSDDRSLGLNKASTLYSSFYTKFIPISGIEITPFAGFANNEQIGQKDAGSFYGSEADIDRFDINDFEFNSILKFQNEDISPRKNTLRLLSTNVKSNLDQALNNSISAYYIQQRRDFYFSADSITADQFNIKNNIQSRTETNYFLQDRVVYLSPASGLTLDIQGRTAWRVIDRNTRYISTKNITSSTFDTKIQEFRLDFASSLNYRSDNFNSNMKISFSEKEEKHLAKRIENVNEVFFNDRVELEAQKNNKSQIGAVSLSGDFLLSQNNTLSFSLFQRKLRYDTPSQLNYDDRDELLSIGHITFIHRFSPLFSSFVNLEGTFNKIVYIFAERSSNNNVKRTIRLSSGGVYTGKNFMSTNSAEVSANYTVYDYEEFSTGLKSFSFRQFVFRDSTSLNTGRRTKFLINGYIKLSEQGDFSWSSFSSLPQRYLSEHYLEPKIVYTYSQINLGVGLRYFSLQTFGYKDNAKVRQSAYQSIGPLSEISIMINSILNFKLYGWYEFIKAEDNTKREQANLNFQLLWNL